MPYRTAWVPPKKTQRFPWKLLLQVLALVVGNVVLFAGLWCLLPGLFFAMLIFICFPAILKWIVLVLKSF